jgi:hypothetical protein
LHSDKTSYPKEKRILSHAADKISKLAQTQSIYEKFMFLRQTAKAMEMSKYLALTGG